MNAVQHSAKSTEWGTPDCVLERARMVGRGSIDYDPCSSPEFNARVLERWCLTDSALEMHDWKCLRDTDIVLVNPPGNRPHEPNMPRAFWRKLMEQRHRFGHAIWVGFTMEHLRHCQGGDLPALVEFPLCVPRERLKFVRPDGTVGKSPGHANVIGYVPGNIDERDRFYAAFESLGACR